MPGETAGVPMWYGMYLFLPERHATGYQCGLLVLEKLLFHADKKAMDIRIRTNQTIYIIDLQGEMALADSILLKELVMKMIEKKVEKFIINMKNISTFDSSGIGALIYISSTLRKMNLDLTIANVQGPVKDVIELTKLSNYFIICEDVKTAIETLS
jgi:anti-sigma B factor antagonist